MDVGFIQNSQPQQDQERTNMQSELQTEEVEDDDEICIVQPGEASSMDTLNFRSTMTDLPDDQHEQGPETEEKETKAKPLYRRVELCMADKLRVIAAGATGMSQRQIAKQFGVSKTQVQTLLKRKDEIVSRYDNGWDNARKRTKFERKSYEEVNEILWKWYVEEMSGGMKDDVITGAMIKAKATSISQEIGLEGEFKASNSWLEDFKRRYDIRTQRRAKRDNRLGGDDVITMVAIQTGSEGQESISFENRGHDESDGGRNGMPVMTSPQEVIPNTNETTLDNRGHNSERISSEARRTLEMRPNENDPKIHNIFSMQRPLVHPVQPVLMPAQSMPMFRHSQAPIVPQSSIEVPQLRTPINNNEQQRPHSKVKNFTDALVCCSALKSFAVDRGSVTLIGLMTAMEHEIQREKRNSYEDEFGSRDIND
eukprot:Seg2073.7 transcript_id=Seg2073.7/GoldUCD/mRNA.D3Y31 product="Tigger transposable element-derived protein 2" protein_id=Seg2073.7/GoldUCD/D3Y31